MNTGGVEVAISKSAQKLRDEFDYRLYFVKSHGSIEAGQKPVYIFLESLFSSNSRPDVVVTSLWWSHPFGFIARMFGAKWVVFLHSPGFASLPDFVFTRFAHMFGHYFFFDSEKTQQTLTAKTPERSFIIPYMTVEIENLPEVEPKPAYDIVWVGRNAPVKRLDLVSDLLAEMLTVKAGLQVLLCVAGTRCAMLDGLASAYPDNIDLNYNLSPDEVLALYRQSRIALCLSDYEGFSVSTAEAAVSGNLIAGRRIGELSSYLPANETAWLENDSDACVKDFAGYLSALLADADVLLHRRKVTADFSRSRLSGASYRQAFSNAVRALAGSWVIK